ncbi:unnamed protein product [Sphagnum tenellum]
MTKMKKGEIRQNLPVMYSLQKCQSHDEQHCLLSELGDRPLNFFCNCVNQILHDPKSVGIRGQSELSTFRNAMLPEKQFWITLAKPSKTLEKKRRMISKHQTGGALPLILASLVPSLIELVSSAFRKK